MCGKNKSFCIYKWVLSEKFCLTQGKAEILIDSYFYNKAENPSHDGRPCDLKNNAKFSQVSIFSSESENAVPMPMLQEMR